jgi:hypothetical protein
LLNLMAGRGIGQQLFKRFLLLERVEQLLVLQGGFKERLTLSFGERVGGVSSEQLTGLLVCHLAASLI